MQQQQHVGQRRHLSTLHEAGDGQLIIDFENSTSLHSTSPRHSSVAHDDDAERASSCILARCFKRLAPRKRISICMAALFFIIAAFSLFSSEASHRPVVPASALCSHRGAVAGRAPRCAADMVQNLAALARIGITCADVDVSRLSSTSAASFVVAHPSAVAAADGGVADFLPANSLSLDVRARAMRRLFVEPKFNVTGWLSGSGDLHALSAELSAIGANHLSPLRLILSSRALLTDWAAVRAPDTPLPFPIALALRDVDNCEPAPASLTALREVRLGAADASRNASAAALQCSSSACSAMLAADSLMPSLACWRRADVAEAIAAWRSVKLARRANAPSVTCVPQQMCAAQTVDDVAVWIVDDCASAAEVLVLAENSHVDQLRREAAASYVISNVPDSLVKC